ncbi:hypothetical protein D6783_05460 [Candidatus Woesearchaeota archaeon]|nr:MAG: hypothetical protein D6783_05460 [Candidatus Woesearchaeota archaeon]
MQEYAECSPAYFLAGHAVDEVLVNSFWRGASLDPGHSFGSDPGHFFLAFLAQGCLLLLLQGFDFFFEFLGPAHNFFEFLCFRF